MQDKLCQLFFQTEMIFGGLLFSALDGDNHIAQTCFQSLFKSRALRRKREHIRSFVESAKATIQISHRAVRDKDQSRALFFCADGRQGFQAKLAPTLRIHPPPPLAIYYFYHKK